MDKSLWQHPDRMIDDFSANCQYTSELCLPLFGHDLYNAILMFNHEPNSCKYHRIPQLRPLPSYAC